MVVPANPYIAGNPVGDSPAFVGRTDVLREVLRVLRRPQSNAIVLYGQRRVGKTSILQHLAIRLPQEGLYRPVYFDLQDKATWPLSRVLQDLARTVAHALGQPDPDLGSDPEIFFREQWLPDALDSLPEGCALVLLFDEFDVLADPKTEQAAAAFFPYLRDLLSTDQRRLQFVFVIGRNVDDLANIALSLFKGTPAQRISLLSHGDTKHLVRLSKRNGTLMWPDDAIEQVWQLTCGHPFLTQALCSYVWEQAHDEEDEPEGPPVVMVEGVDSVVPDTLDASRHALEWLWDGLPPAERVVASALAEAGPGSITQTELERLLRESGVRVVIRELQNAPQLLQDWDLIEPADKGYRFRVELLRCWIAEHKPLRRVQEELDRIRPVAESLYQAAVGLYEGGQLGQAVGPLRQAVGLNPNHVRANQLLADILLSQGELDEAQQLLERLYEYQPAAARPLLVQALLAQAQAAKSDDDRLTLYERVLELAPAQSEAVAGQQRVWQRRGDAAAKIANPFSFGKPVSDPAHFYGREREIRQIVGRLLSAFESTSVVGERRFGKTSLLTHLAHPQVAAELGLTPDRYIIVYLDFQGITDITPARFWSRVLRRVARALPDGELAATIEETAAQPEIDQYDVEDLFLEIEDRELRLVLLMDEFEYVTQSPNVGVDFFAGLRALAIHTPLALVIATRRELVDLVHSDAIKGSPFFNIFANVVLRSFSPEETTAVIDGALEGTSITFSKTERAYVSQIAGGHPAFLQMAGYFCFEGHQMGLSGDALREHVAGGFREQAEPHFAYMWGHSSENERVTLLTLLTLGWDGTQPTQEQLTSIYPRTIYIVPDLIKRGLVLEQNGRVSIFSPIFAEWLLAEMNVGAGEEADEQAMEVWIRARGGTGQVYPDQVRQALPRLKQEYWLLIESVFEQVPADVATQTVLRLSGT